MRGFLFIVGRAPLILFFGSLCVCLFVVLGLLRVSEECGLPIDPLLFSSLLLSAGPMKRTVNDYWRMLWEQKVFVVVMTTK